MKRNFNSRFDELSKEANSIVENKYNKYSQMLSQNLILVDETRLATWEQRVKNLLADVYGKDSDFYKDFINAKNNNFLSTNYEVLLKKQKPIFDSAFVDMPYQSKENGINNDKYSLERIQKICSNFHNVARQLQNRHNDRNTLDIEDEYDVQDLLHSLLRVDFDDIRPEEYSPSYASSSSRVDFLLKEQKIIIEVKKTRKSLKTKEIGEQLIVDIARYNEHPDCELLVCFIYDPDAKISNPMGLIRDLEKNNHKVKIIINPI